MPLNGLRWSRNSGSANCDMPQSAVFGRPGGGIDDNLVYGLDVLLCQTEEVQVYAVIFGEFAQPVVVEIFQQWNQHPLVSQTKEKFVWENIRHSI